MLNPGQRDNANVGTFGGQHNSTGPRASIFALGTAVESPEPSSARTCNEWPDGESSSRNAQPFDKTSHTFTTTSPASLKCVFRAFLILQLTTLYSGHMASESLTLLVIRLSIISGKWKVLLRMPGAGRLVSMDQLFRRAAFLARCDP